MATDSKTFSSGRSTPSPTILVAKSPETHNKEGARGTAYLVPGSDADNISSSAALPEVVGIRPGWERW